MEKPNILHIHLRKEYFEDIKKGFKDYEYRLRNDRWKKTLVDRDYDLIYLYLGYPKKGDMDRTIIRVYHGYKEVTIEHKEFGGKAGVFAIDVHDFPGTWMLAHFGLN